MTMDEVIARINELAKKNKTVGLTDDEIQERAKLREIYLDSIRKNLRSQLDNTYIVDSEGNKRKLNTKS